MLTPTGKTVLAGGIAFAVGGVLFGNWPFFGAGALLLILGSFAGLARTPSVSREVDRTRVERGGRVRITLRVEAPRGLGVLEVHQALPDELDLVEGNNFHLLTLGLRPRTVEYAMVVRIPKRGEWVLPPAGVKVLHPLGLSETVPLTVGEQLTIIAEPRAISARVPQDLRTRAKRPFPEGDIARMGVATNEFRELREYAPGDPPRRINWKATARRMESGVSNVPLVNETEWEGKKCVWILVDGHARLSVGTNIEDARERAADAAISLVELYLRRGYQVGMALVRSGNVPPLRPGTGESQVVRARELLARLAPADGPSIVEVLDRDATHLHRGRPLVVLLTRLSEDDADQKAALVRLGAIGRMHGRNVVPGVVVDLEPAQPADDNEPSRVAAFALARAQMSARASARAAGLRVAAWRFEHEPLQAILARGRIA